ncbi:glycoside hydrolase family 16 protein [Stigmatella aurantiaca]|uniref:Beta-glucanase n=1 Tax=Stigmatella aurantiaca (strain DW4/3-1) TaxID=378806 RepID=Q08V83_STIAD|nr:glycoside hydrolase family 16 protein [Stigmatella aurantiaca]ADO68979.1 Beta-glucanase [Stigmatella aurantiaca DW4/3-1]EAU64387.1 beta-glucanase [Stigmatella aurantiaca DW4/3-1]
MRGSKALQLRSQRLVTVQGIALSLCLLFATAASAATSGYTLPSSSSIQFYVNDAPWADLHYQLNGGSQQNFRMTRSGNNNLYTVTGVPSGAAVRYFFTIGNTSGGATDTAWAQFTMGGGTTPPPTGGWAVVWEDTFSTNGQPNAANWSYHAGNGFNPGNQSFSGWGNGEWEWYRPSNTYVQDGNLVIRADYNKTATRLQNRDWFQFSGRITTKGKKSWKYGRVEARIAMPSAVGTWPAFWMMGTACDDTVTTTYTPAADRYDTMASNWSSCGEIDIMEHKNTETRTFQNVFWDSRTGLFPWADGQNNEQPSNINVGNVTQFHLYSIEWEPTQIRWYVDRETNPSPVHTVDITAGNKEEFQKPFHIILNLALSGIFTGYLEPNPADFPMYMKVDYVRVWQRQ